MSIELGGISAKFNSKIGLVYVPPISRYLVPGQEMDVRDGMHLSTTYQTIGLYIYIYPEPDRPLNLGTQKIIHPWIQKIIFWVKNRILGKRPCFVKGCFLIIPKIHVDGNRRLNPPKWIIRYDKLRLILGCPSQQGFHNLFPAATGSERFFFRQHRVRSGYGGLGLGARVEIKLGKPE